MTIAADDFAITVLGADGSYPGPGGACSGYLLRYQGFCTWMDAGTGTLANLQLHVPLVDLDAVVISHSHADHCSDLRGLYVASKHYVKRKGLPVYAPADVKSLMDEGASASPFDWHTTKDGMVDDIGPLRWTWSQTDHPVQTLAARVDAGDRSLGYSADTGSHWSLSSLRKGVTLALVEASLGTEAEGSWHHLSARQAGAAAAAAGAERLVITHMVPGTDREQARELASKAFGRAADAAAIGDTWLI